MTDTKYNQHIALIRQAMAQRYWPRVEALAKEIVNTPAGEADGNYFLGLVASNTGKQDIAESLFSKALQLDPNRIDAKVELSDFALNKRNYDDAKNILISIDISYLDDAFYLFKTGKSWQRLNQFDAAFQYFEKAYKLAPNQPEILVELAKVASTIGKLELAKEIYQKLLAKFASNQQFHYELSTLFTAENDLHIQQMKTISEHPQNGSANKVFLHSAMGKEFEDLKDWKNAFKYYKASADEAKYLSNYSVTKDLELISSLKEVSTEVAEQVSAVDGGAKTPIFITGLPRSGTTLLDKILSGHSDVTSADESFFYPVAMQNTCGLRAESIPSSDAVRAAAKVDKSDIAKRYMALINHRLGSENYFIEKLPENFLYLSFIAASFPSAKLIFVERHPVDLCLALYKQPYFRYAYNLNDLAQFYIAAMELIEVYKSLLGDRLMIVKYEDLVQQPEQTIVKLFESMEIDFEPDCMEFHKRTSSSSSASKSQVRQPIHTRSVDKWRKFESELKPITDMFDKHKVRY